jgi:hypothetical protein
MSNDYSAADTMALEVYRRSRATGSPHILAFNIACAAWYARSPGASDVDVRARVQRLMLNVVRKPQRAMMASD